MKNIISKINFELEKVREGLKRLGILMANDKKRIKQKIQSDGIKIEGGHQPTDSDLGKSVPPTTDNTL